MNKTHTMVVGGTSGIGNTVVKHLAWEGHFCSVLGRHRPPIDANMKSSIDYWTVDLSKQKKCALTLKKIIQKNGKLNNLVFLQRYRDKKQPWEGELSVGLTATKLIVEQLAEHFDSKGGAIVFVSSINADLIHRGLSVGYHLCKAGLNLMARYYAVRLGRKGIRVNAVSPGTVLKEESKKFYLRNKKLHALYKKMVPLGEMVTAENIASLVSFLCSSKSAGLTGQTIVMDGGLSLLWQESMVREFVR